jgi:hypothetical protein
MMQSFEPVAIFRVEEFKLLIGIPGGLGLCSTSPKVWQGRWL